MFFISSQVDEIYHDESLGTNINIVLVRMIMVGYRQVSFGIMESVYRRGQTDVHKQSLVVGECVCHRALGLGL